jgi:hypothetical protein
VQNKVPALLADPRERVEKFWIGPLSEIELPGLVM